MKNKGAILFGILGILVFIFLGFIYFLNNDQQNNSNQVAIQEENVISVQEEEGNTVPAQKEEIVKSDDKDIKERFKATEIVSNNLPESIEFWTEANCPNEGLDYEYELPQRFKLLDCEKGEKGSHGGCKTCEMSKIILWPREDIYIPLEKLKSDGEIIKFFDENNVISNYCNEGKCVDVISRNGGFLPEEIKRNISDYSLDKSYVAITGGCKSKGCRTTTFLIDESTGFSMPPQYSEFGCINSFVDSVELNMNRPPFFRIECSYYFDNFLTSENSLIYLSNGKIKVLPKISTYLMDGNSNDREWKVVDTYNRFVDLDGDNNKEIIEIGKSYIDTEKGKIEKEVIVNIYKWEDSKKIFELLPKTDKLYLDEDIYGPYLGFCMTQVGFESMRSWGVKVPEGYDGVGSVIADESFCREIDPGYSSFSNDCVSYDACKKDGVVSNSSAKKAGLASGDVVLEINGERFRKMDLVGLLEKYKVGDVVKIKVVKEGEIREVEVELERRPVDF